MLQKSESTLEARLTKREPTQAHIALPKLDSVSRATFFEHFDLITTQLEGHPFQLGANFIQARHAKILGLQQIIGGLAH